MLSVEERCLENLAWQQGSSLYTSLMAACGTFLHPAPAPAAPPAQQAQQAQQRSASPPQSSERLAAGGGATPRKRGLEEANAPEDAAGAQQQPRQQPQQQQSMYDAQGRLPLFLGCDPPSAAAAGSQQAAANGAAGQHATLATLGDRSARAAVSALASSRRCPAKWHAAERLSCCRWR